MNGGNKLTMGIYWIRTEEDTDIVIVFSKDHDLLKEYEHIFNSALNIVLGSFFLARTLVLEIGDEYLCEVLPDAYKVGALLSVVRKLSCRFVFAAQIVYDNIKHYFGKKTFDCALNFCCSFTAL